MRLDEIQAGLQIPNAYHSTQTDRLEKTPTLDDREQTVNAELLPSGTLPAMEQTDKDENRLNAVRRPVDAVQNDPIQSRDNLWERTPGAIVDLQA